MNILCITSSKDALSLNTSTMVLNKTILEGLKGLGYCVDLVTFDYYNDSSIINDNEINLLINKLYLIKTKKKEKNNTSLEIHKNNYFLKIISKLKIFFENTLLDILSPNYDENELKNILEYKRYDIILTLCPPTDSPLLTRDLIKKNKLLKKTKWIQYWSDPVAASMLDFKKKLPVKRYLHKIVETFALRKADEIVYCTPLLCEMQKKIHPKLAEKMRFVDVGYVKEYFEIHINKDKDSIKKNINIGYFGAYHTNVRNILTLFNAMQKIDNCSLNVCGDTNIEDLKYKNVNISIGRLSYNKVKKMEQQSDILVCLCNKSGVQIPGKIFYYASYNKPIIVILDGNFKNELRSYLTTFDRYILCDNNEDSIEQAVNEAIDILPDFEVRLPERLRPEIVARSIINNSRYNNIL